jgi:hypothetical protein
MQTFKCVLLLMGCIFSKSEPSQESYVYDVDKQQYHTPYDLPLTNPTMTQKQTVVSKSYFKEFIKKYRNEQDAYTQIVT